ncbi:MAG: hypothetical protein LBG11_05595 [Bifidobacteriaceae bacterium]|jgi:hypothetical protein|nr:hypothetical protein [Bifidobacteriaceae bacterium]
MASAAFGFGLQAFVGALLGLTWLLIAPRPAATWVGTFWYAEDQAGFGAAQDTWFALLVALPGLAVGILLSRWSERPHPVRRLVCWLVGGVLGSTCCWLVGSGLGGGFGSPGQGDSAQAAPLTLTAPGLLALWPFASALIVTAVLAARAAFGRTW